MDMKKTALETENTFKISKTILIHRMTGKVNCYMECLVERPCGKREYLTGREWDALNLKQSR